MTETNGKLPGPTDRIAAYIRFSGLQQKDSEERQRGDIDAGLASLKPPARVKGWFVDEGEKRERAELRPAFQKLMGEG